MSGRQRVKEQELLAVLVADGDEMTRMMEKTHASIREMYVSLKQARQMIEGMEGKVQALLEEIRAFNTRVDERDAQRAKCS
jgi:uncharacterized coiled-coil DUF342 family protein